MRGVSIKYGDIAPEAKENFAPTTDDKMEFVNLEQLQMYNLSVTNYANPCEQYQTVLDSSQSIFPENPSEVNMGLWSNSISGIDGIFSAPVVLALTSSGNYTSKGFTLTFDTENNIFCNDLNIKWYNGTTLLADEDFSPTSAFYFCQKEVQYFNKVVMTFRALNMPYNRLKLRAIDFGYGTYFYGDELKNVKIIQEIDPISENIIINTCDFSLSSKSDMEYNFQSKQPLSIYFNNVLRATQFVDTSKRTGKRQWDIQTNDYFGLLDKITFTGGIYVNQNAKNLLISIFTQAKVPYSVAGILNAKTISGHIPICSCRQAIQMICFAIGAVADTSNSDKVNVFVLPTTISQNIEKNRIRQGQTFETSDKVTEVRLTQHAFTPNDEITKLYDTAETGQGENIFVSFSQPMHDLTISGSGTIVNQGANFAIITAMGSAILNGKGYTDNTTVKSRKNPNLLASDISNIKEITNQTLISSTNIDGILDLCFEHYTKNDKVNLSIFEGKHLTEEGQTVYDATVELGDVITTETEYLGTLQGRVISERFSLNGGIILKECELI